MQDTQPIDETAHFVPLPVIIDEYEGLLHDYMQRHAARNVVVTMSVEMDVAKRQRTKFFVAVALTFDFDTPEAVSDEAHRQCPKGHQCLFAWVPAHLFGRDEFAIMIDEIGAGETLQNGLVNEIIESASVETAVLALTDVS